MQLEGAVALVTGGAKGLGFAIATHLQAQGARVVVADLDAEAMANLPGDMEGCVLDVTRPGDAIAMVKGVIERHGRIDVQPAQIWRFSLRS